MNTATKTATREIKTAWSGWVQTFPDPDEPTRTGVSMSVYGKTLPELIQSIYRGATYYHALGYRCVAQRITRDCVACHGSGEFRKVSKRDPSKTIKCTRCSACRGKGTFEAMNDFELTPSKSITMGLK